MACTTATSGYPTLPPAPAASGPRALPEVPVEAGQPAVLQTTPAGVSIPTAVDPNPVLIPAAPAAVPVVPGAQPPVAAPQRAAAPQPAAQQPAAPTTTDSIFDTFNIYGLDNDGREEVVRGQVQIPRTLTLNERVQMLADVVSRSQFDGRPILLYEMRETERGQLAIFALLNPPDVTDPRGPGSWWPMFQGATRAHATELTLFGTMLQPHYQGPWIAGAAFVHSEGFGEHAQRLPGPMWRP